MPNGLRWPAHSKLCTLLTVIFQPVLVWGLCSFLSAVFVLKGSPAKVDHYHCRRGLSAGSAGISLQNVLDQHLTLAESNRSSSFLAAEPD